MDTARYVKICGITRASDALACVEAGASAIGLNFVPGSRRRVDEPAARRIADAVRGQIEIVAVVANLSAAEMRRLRDAIGADFLQLHGEEPDEALAQVLPGAFKAVRIGDARDAAGARAVPGPRLLADAKVPGEAGGTGVAFDWTLVRELARERRLIVAGGLTPENVGAAVQAVEPWGVDVASGVEASAGIKAPERVRAFVRAARAPRSP